MSDNLRRQLRQELDLPVPVATWVILAHVFVLACPLAIIWAVDVYAGQLPNAFANPGLIKLAAAVYIGATAFEVAQNSADRWYLTESTRSISDLFFNAFMIVAFCMFSIGFYANPWMTTIAVVATLLYPVAYIYDHPSQRALSSIVLLLATAGLYLVTRDPTVILFWVGNGLAMYFILSLLRQQAQMLHGFAAFTFGCAFLAWPWAIANAAHATPNSWLFVAGVAVVAVMLGFAVAPVISRMAATPRPSRQ